MLNPIYLILTLTAAYVILIPNKVTANGTGPASGRQSSAAGSDKVDSVLEKRIVTILRRTMGEEAYGSLTPAQRNKTIADSVIAYSKAGGGTPKSLPGGNDGDCLP
jgi:hypothetical protein